MSTSSSIAVSANLQEKYEHDYQEGSLAWRALGAKWKASNIEKILRRNNIDASRTIDIGAGDGAVAIELLNRNALEKIACNEISASGLACIKAANNPHITDIQHFDGYTMPYKDKAFTFGFASHVLEHVEHERVFLNEVTRVCDLVYIEVPLEDTLRMPQNYRPNILGHINFYRTKTLRHLLQSTGLEVVDLQIFSPPLAIHKFHTPLKGLLRYAIRWPLDKLFPHFSARIFNVHCGVLVRKASEITALHSR